MRYIKDIMLEKAILHVIDSHADEAILTEKELSINEEVEEFVRKHVLRSLNDDETFTCRFFSENVTCAQAVHTVVEDNDKFVDVSKVLTEHMFQAIKHSDIPAGDMLYVQYIADEQRCFGILKLDYQMSYMHNIAFEDENLCINLVSQEVGLPNLGQRLKKCAFFTKAPENQIEMIVLDKKQKIEDGNENYFIEDFLEAVRVTDDTDRTRRFKATVEKWTQKNLADQIEAADTVRELVNETLLLEDKVSVDEIASQMFEDVPEIRESFKEAVAEAGYREGTEFGIDKTWVEKKMKSKQIKTDTGVVIRGEFDFFKDSQRFIVKKNGDGTVDYIIKNVRNVSER
ncbi:nucleoid-associated protein [Acidaminobacter sp. JC074]|uniref:nucleoid-associated protein n=1 Tax=Acidaminobacter sp. JC074 TaxID=2530199 RepID=UPI001F0CE28C|nr:nucleoid-associated protein [Acidaminobacter sp. JC074]MCH4890751.1 nucleoid-associated protein [Acidaminobacter sp. JC074]